LIPINTKTAANVGRKHGAGVYAPHWLPAQIPGEEPTLSPSRLCLRPSRWGGQGKGVGKPAPTAFNTFVAGGKNNKTVVPKALARSGGEVADISKTVKGRAMKFTFMAGPLGKKTVSVPWQSWFIIFSDKFLYVYRF